MKEAHWSYVPALASASVRAHGCSFGGFSERSPMPVERLEVPVASNVILLCCEAPMQLSGASKNESASWLRAFSAGLQVPAQRVKHAGVNDCIEIRLPPLAAFSLFGGALAERNRVPVDLLDIAPGPMRALMDEICSASDWGSRLRAVDRFLERALADSDERVSTELVWAWQTLERSHGQTSVAALARRIGWSERHFTNRFRAHFGVGPKTAARRLRFSFAFGELMSGSASDLCGIAARAGFSDQSHMTREFRDLAGMTPVRLREARFADLPGIPAAALAN